MARKAQPAKASKNGAVPRAKVEQVIADLGVTMTPQEIDRVLAELGYDARPEPPPAPAPIPASLPAGSGDVIAIIHGDCDRDILSQVLTGIADALPAGQPTILLPVDMERPHWIADIHKALARHRPAGVLLLPAIADAAPLSQAIQAAGIRYSAISPTAASAGFATHDRAAAGAAIDRLVALGHRRIALVSGPDSSATSRERELGYLDALADHGLDRGAALIEAGDLGFESGKQAATLLLEISPRPTAIIAANEAMAIGVLHAALARGVKVPDALSVIGFGDEGRAAAAWPPLSTVDVPYREMAAAAALHLAGSPAPGLAAPIEPRLTPRGTLAQAKG